MSWHLQLHQTPQHVHVVGLAFDGVREEGVSLLGLEEGQRDLLDCQDDVAAAQILVDARPGRDVLVGGEDALRRRLERERRDARASVERDIVGHQGDARLPPVFVFAADPDTAHGCGLLARC